MAVTRIASQIAGPITASVPSLQDGDLAIGLAYRISETLSLPSGWTSLNARTANSNGLLLCYRVVSGTSLPAARFAPDGTSTRSQIAIYRGCDTSAAPQYAVQVGSSTSHTHPALTPAKASAFFTAWYINSANRASTTPTGFTAVQSTTGFPLSSGMFENLALAASWDGQTIAHSLNQAWACHTVALTPLDARRLKHWNGSTWEPGTLKQYDGSAWVAGDLKQYDGSAWV